jgi:hypothetical protein
MLRPITKTNKKRFYILFQAQKIQGEKLHKFQTISQYIDACHFQVPVALAVHKMVEATNV